MPYIYHNLQGTAGPKLDYGTIGGPSNLVDPSYGLYLEADSKWSSQGCWRAALQILEACCSRLRSWGC